MSFDTNVITLKDRTTVELIGDITEDSDFQHILSIKSSSYEFNFEQIQNINSCGIREWLSFLDQLPKDAQITYTHCSQVIIEQINIVHGFIRDNVTVESLYAPYFCDDCDLEKKELLNVGDIENKEAPARDCEKCGNPMEFDAIEDQYFNFIK